MTILVTGAAGFIGSNFILDWFRESNEDVVSLDLLTYAGDLRNLSSLDKNPHHHFIHGNIADKHLVLELLKKYHIVESGVYKTDMHLYSYLSPHSLSHRLMKNADMSNGNHQGYFLVADCLYY